MSENLDPVRTNLISAAAMLAGPGAAQQAISDNVIALAVLARDGSPVMERLDRVLDAQMFVSTITSVEREPSSTRDIVHFRGRPTEEHPEGQTESIRTERTDNAEGAAMSVMARRMIGHRVVCYKVFDTITRKGQTQKVRILGWLTDLGLPDGAAGVGVDPTVPQGRAEADSGPAPSRVAHEEPYDAMPSESRGTMVTAAPAGGTATPTPVSPVPVKQGPSPDQIRDSFRKPANVTPPPAPVLADDGVPLGAPGIPGLPEGKMRADVDPTDPPLANELGVIAQHALRLTSGSDSAEHEANAHELVEALCCYSLVAPEDGVRSYLQIRSRYHAAQLRSYLERQRTPQAVGS